MNEQPRDEAQARLADLDEGVALPTEQSPKRNRKKAVIVFFALLVLAAVTCVGGYALLRGKQVDLKANKRLPEKPTSGSDIQKAAFDSIRDSLAAPSPTPSSGSSIGNPATPIPSSSGERVAPPIKPGIAATLAPPPEVIAKPTPQVVAATQPAGPVKSTIPLTTTQSVRFAATPKSSPVASENNAPSPVEITLASAETSIPALSKHNANLPAFGAMLPVRLLSKDLRLFHEKTRRFPNNFAEINTLLWRTKPTPDYGKNARQARTKNYYYFYTRVDDRTCALWALPTGPRRQYASSFFLVLAPDWLRAWKGNALDDAKIEQLPAIPHPDQLASLAMAEQPARVVAGHGASSR